jgi:hypothetical protein
LIRTRDPASANLPHPIHTRHSSRTIVMCGRHPDCKGSIVGWSLSYAGAVMCTAFVCGFSPLAMMLAADEVPIIPTVCKTDDTIGLSPPACPLRSALHHSSSSLATYEQRVGHRSRRAFLIGSPSLIGSPRRVLLAGLVDGLPRTHRRAQREPTRHAPFCWRGQPLRP